MRVSTGHWIRHVGWWALLLTRVADAGFAFAMAVTYPVAVFLGWALNIPLVEVWLRLARSARSHLRVARPVRTQLRGALARPASERRDLTRG